MERAKLTPAEGDHALYLNGELLLHGDAFSVQVIFNNLSGVNTVSPGYIEMMAERLEVRSWIGKLVLKGGQQTPDTHHF